MSNFNRCEHYLEDIVGFLGEVAKASSELDGSSLMSMCGKTAVTAEVDPGSLILEPNPAS